MGKKTRKTAGKYRKRKTNRGRPALKLLWKELQSLASSVLLFLDARRRKIALALLILTVAGLLVTGALIARTAQRFIVDEDSQAWTPGEMVVYGYETDGNIFYTVREEPHFYVADVERYIRNVCVRFSEGLPETLLVHVFYTDAPGKTHNEAQVVSRWAEAGVDIVYFPVESYVDNLRVDIGDSIGDSFTLESLVVNDRDTYNDTVRLALFRLCVMALLVVAMGAVGVLMCCRVKLEVIYLVAALSLGIAYMLVITPYSVPDEPHHYNSSYLVSGYLLRQTDPKWVDLRDISISGWTGHHNTPGGYLKLIREGVHRLPEATAADMGPLPEPYNVQYPCWFLPQALGIVLARLVRLNFIGIFYLGRAFNLLFYVLCVYFSMKRLPGFRLPLFFIGLLPISLHQAASFSYDAFINGLTLLFFAYAVSCVYVEKDFRPRHYAAALLMAALLGPAKVVYLPLLFLSFLAARRWKGGGVRSAWIPAGLVVAAGLITTAIFGAAAWNSSTNFSGDGVTNYTLSFVFEHPIQTVHIFLRTLAYNWEAYLYGAFGNYLSGLSLHLPRVYVNIFILTLIAGVFYEDGENYLPSVWDRAVYLSISALVVGLCMASMFFMWTSDTQATISGIQGRYFTPLIPLLFFSLKNKKWRYSSVAFRNGLISLFVLMQGAAIHYILRFTIARY